MASSWTQAAMGKLRETVGSKIGDRLGMRSSAPAAAGAGAAPASSAGMSKPKEVDYRDTNVANIGSSEDKAARKGAAETEEMWVGAGEKEGLQIWRVENKKRDFGINHWPKDKYGSFHEGDSYIVLYTYKKPDAPKLYWDIHFWLGRSTSQDEAGTAAYKTVELDDLLDTEPVQYRETQGWESEKFLSHFPSGIRILSGGVASGFVHVEPEKYVPKLMQVRRVKKDVRVVEVPCQRASLNQGDAFILDAGLKLYLWSGSSANAFETRKAADTIELIKSERNGRANEVEVDDEFWRLLGGQGPIAAASAGVDIEERVDNKLFRYDSTSDNFVLFASGTLNRGVLTSDAAFLLDTGSNIYVWLGVNVDRLLKSTAVMKAQDYLTNNGRPAHLPISRVIQGGESELFNSSFVGQAAPIAAAPAPAAATPTAPASAGAGARAGLQVTVHRARGLAAGDRGGTSDPFVRLRLSDRKKGQEAQTAVIKKTLTPEWNETHTIAGPIDPTLALDVEVWDKDMFSSDFLGTARIPLSSIELTTFPSDYALGGSGPGGLTITGNVTLSLVWK